MSPFGVALGRMKTPQRLIAGCSIMRYLIRLVPEAQPQSRRHQQQSCRCNYVAEPLYPRCGSQPVKDMLRLCNYGQSDADEDSQYRDAPHNGSLPSQAVTVLVSVSVPHTSSGGNHVRCISY